ncbi:MAG: SH3 domain-containing protein, partial [Firmicutes bacterium]|nr:SH3 domain-containing protein [Bacillota bacterium]
GGGGGIAASAGSYPLAVVNNPNPADRLNLRAAPSRNAVSLGKYYTGVIVVVIDDRNPTWWKVKLESSGLTGYMDSAYLTICGDQGRRDEAVIARVGSAMPKAVVGGQRPQDGLHLRDKPSEKGNSYGKFYNGTAVEILGLTADGVWYHVYVPRANAYGYMLANYVQMERPLRDKKTGGSASAFPGYNTAAGKANAAQWLGGKSKKFSASELKAAWDCVVEYATEPQYSSYPPLLKGWYDEDFSDANLEYLLEYLDLSYYLGTSKVNIIMLLTLSSNPLFLESPFSWHAQWILIRDSKFGAWRVVATDINPDLPTGP